MYKSHTPTVKQPYAKRKRGDVALKRALLIAAAAAADARVATAGGGERGAGLPPGGGCPGPGGVRESHQRRDCQGRIHERPDPDGVEVASCGAAPHDGAGGWLLLWL